MDRSEDCLPPPLIMTSSRYRSTLGGRWATSKRDCTLCSRVSGVSPALMVFTPDFRAAKGCSVEA